MAVQVCSCIAIFFGNSLCCESSSQPIFAVGFAGRSNWPKRMPLGYLTALKYLFFGPLLKLTDLVRTSAEFVRTTTLTLQACAFASLDLNNATTLD